jgi:hypothetical protein
VTYSVLGVPISFSSDVEEALERIDASYRPFESESDAETEAPGFEPVLLELRRLSDEEGFSVRDSGGYEQSWLDAEAAVIDSLNRLTALVLANLHARRRVLAVHAAAVVHRGEALIVAGPSGAGKTTLGIGLARRGLGLLSDELAVIDTDTGVVLPYRRSLHVRPQTVDLLPELDFLRARPRHQLGGGIEWALTPDEFELALPAGLGAAAPLRSVLLLDGVPNPSRVGGVTPIPAALAAMELLRSTWKASIDFDGTMTGVVGVVGGARCGRLEVGELESTLDAVTRWLEEGLLG